MNFRGCSSCLSGNPRESLLGKTANWNGFGGGNSRSPKRERSDRRGINTRHIRPALLTAVLDKQHNHVACCCLVEMVQLPVLHMPWGPRPSLPEKLGDGLKTPRRCEPTEHFKPVNSRTASWHGRLVDKGAPGGYSPGLLPGSRRCHLIIHQSERKSFTPRCNGAPHSRSASQTLHPSRHD